MQKLVTTNGAKCKWKSRRKLVVDVGQVVSVPVNCSSWRYKQPILIYFVRFELSRSLFDPLFFRVGIKHFSDNLLKVGTVSFERETTFYQHSTLQIFAVP